MVSLLPDAGSPWIKYGVVFLALDALDYVYHSVMHLLYHFDNFIFVATPLFDGLKEFFWNDRRVTVKLRATVTPPSRPLISLNLLRKIGIFGLAFSVQM